MKTMSGVLPWAIVMAGIGGIIWWMLARDMAAGAWLLGGLLFAHGAVHVLFLVPEPETSGGSGWPFDTARSWSGLSGGNARAVGWVLIAATIAAFAIGALATVGIVVPAFLWQPVVIVAAVASTAMLVLFFDPQLVLGLAINAVVVWAAAATWWAPG
jgi:hypothetical protein